MRTNLPTVPVNDTSYKTAENITMGVPVELPPVKTKVRGVRVTKGNNLAIRVEPAIIGDKPFIDYLLNEDRLTGLELRELVEHAKRISDNERLDAIYKEGDTTLDKMHDATKTRVLSMQHSSARITWHGVHNRTADYLIEMRVPIRLVAEKLDKVAITIDKVDYDIGADSSGYYLIKHVPFKYEEGTAAHEFVMRNCMPAVETLLNEVEHLVHFSKKTELTFVDKRTGIEYDPDTLLRHLDRINHEGFFTYPVLDDSGKIKYSAVDGTIKQFYIDFLRANTEKITKAVYKPTDEEDHITIFNGTMTMFLRRYDVVAPDKVLDEAFRCKKPGDYDKLKHLIPEQYPELKEMLATNILLNRDDYSGDRKKDSLGSVKGASNMGKSFLINKVFHALGLQHPLDLNTFLMYMGAPGTRISGKLSLDSFVRPRMLLADEAAKALTGKNREQIIDALLKMETGIEGRTLRVDDATIFISQLMMLSRKEQGELTDELLNRTIVWNWEASKPLNAPKMIERDGKRVEISKWVRDDVTQKEFKALTMWYVYETYKEFERLSNDDLEYIVEGMSYFVKRSEELKQHKVSPSFHLMNKFGTIIEGYDWGSHLLSMPFIDSDRHSWVSLDVALPNTKKDFASEALCVVKKQFGKDVPELRDNMLEDARKFVQKNSIGVSKGQKSYHGVLNGKYNGYHFFPVWMKVLAKEINGEDTKDTNIMEPAHTPAWPKLKEMTYEGLLDLLEKNDVRRKSMEAIRDIYTALILAAYREGLEETDLSDNNEEWEV